MDQAQGKVAEVRSDEILLHLGVELITKKIFCTDHGIIAQFPRQGPNGAVCTHHFDDVAVFVAGVGDAVAVPVGRGQRSVGVFIGNKLPIILPGQPIAVLVIGEDYRSVAESAVISEQVAVLIVGQGTSVFGFAFKKNLMLILKPQL